MGSAAGPGLEPLELQNLQEYACPTGARPGFRITSSCAVFVFAAEVIFETFTEVPVPVKSVVECTAQRSLWAFQHHAFGVDNMPLTLNLAGLWCVCTHETFLHKWHHPMAAPRQTRNR